MSRDGRSTVLCSEQDTRNSCECAARAALVDQYGRPLSDAEWEAAKRALFAFIRLLVEWDRRGAGGDRPGKPVGNQDRT